jgi:hypothetical protein
VSEKMERKFWGGEEGKDMRVREKKKKCQE